MKKILSIIVAYLLLSVSAFAATNLENDSKANFADYIGKGKWTVIEIWSYDCPSCRKFIHHLSDFDAIAENYNAQVIGISLDGSEMKKQAKAFVSNQDLEFTNLLADVTDVEKLIHSNAPQAPLVTPTLMIFSPEAVFAGIIVGPITTDELVKYFETQAKAEEEQQASPLPDGL